MTTSLPTLAEMLSPTTLVAVFVALWVCFAIFYKSPRTASLYSIPGPPRYPLIGSLLSFPSRGDILEVIMSWCTQYTGGIIHTTCLGRHSVLLYTAESVEPILTSRRLLDKGMNYDTIRPWLGDGLLTSTGSKWHARRRLITPAFHFGILDQFLEVMNEQSAVLVDRLAAAARSGPVNVWPLISEATLDIICETAMGVGVSAQSGHTSKYKTAIHQMAEVANERSLKPWLSSTALFWLSGWKRQQDEALEVLHAFTKSVIEQRRKLWNTGVLSTDDENIGQRKHRQAFLDILLSGGDDRIELSDEEITEETDTFMFEGHDTTASGINWAIFNFARLPDVQQKIHDELDTVLGDSTEAPSRQDLGKLKYLECAIKESLRIQSPVAFLSRTLSEDTVILGHTIPKGVDALILTQMVHRDARHWSHPEQFDPDRFLTENAAARHPFSYIPFSAGPRNCIGQRFAMLEMKVVLVAILRRFRLSTSQEYSDKMLKVTLTVQSHVPLQIRLVPRSGASSS